MEDKEQVVIDKVAVLGTKKKSSQIAQTVSYQGIDVILWGKTEEDTATAMQGISDAIDREILRWGMTESDKRAILARIQPTTKLSDMEDCKVIIEAMGKVFDDKRSILKEVENYCQELELYIIHVSTLSVTEIAAGSSIVSKTIGMHFLEPVPKIPVVELIRGMHTEDRTVAIAMDFARRIGKTSVEVFEYPGYITTRVVMTMINEAIFVLMEGISSAEEIDIAIKLGYNLPMGPLAMADNLGLDDVLWRMDNLFNELQDFKYRPCPLLRKMVRAGKLGRSTGEGFFKYDKKEEF
ncbi:MAG: 3-hydroxyacyl-CoA dehydrogenase NAD-binding domain-containing protein [Gemmatimonadota bacterium]|nr:3-hydroxyacyl-CoA dehydrogenase NAD-binding domain-containing protein [Gemmatimonadota bacterium]